MRIKKLHFLLLILFVFACGKAEEVSDIQKEYFDIRGFFEKEAARLKKSKPLVEKRVAKNQSGEQKILNNIDWEKELALFRESDINKPAWKNSYLISREKHRILYRSKDPALRTQTIEVIYSATGEIIQIKISNYVKNLLYTSSEQLNYYPDSLYSIIKEQKVTLLGSNSYGIVGKFSPLLRSNN